MFAAEFEPAETTSRRRSPRAPVALDARLGKAARTLCKVIDISIHGCRLQTYSALKRGTTIWLTIPGMGAEAGAIAADVMWSDDYIAGCQFQKPIDQAAFDALVERTGGSID